jgi:hypothetical protein
VLSARRAIFLLWVAAEIYAGAQFDAIVHPDIRVALGHRLLHCNRGGHRIDDAPKFRQQAVAGGLDDAA